MQALDQAGHFGFAVGREHDEGVLDAPVGGVGDVRNARQAVELEVVGRGVPAQHASRVLAQVPYGAKVRGKGLHRLAGQAQQFAHQRVALRIARRVAPLADLAQPVVQRVDQQLPALGVLQQVVFQVGVALHDPDVAQHFVQHAGGAPGAAFLSQLVEDGPGPGPEQAQHDLPVGERGVVVGNLAQANGRGVSFGVQVGADAGKRGVHRVSADATPARFSSWRGGAAVTRCPAGQGLTWIGHISSCHKSGQ
jgi:hypothetical protein